MKIFRNRKRNIKSGTLDGINIETPTFKLQLHYFRKYISRYPYKMFYFKRKFDTQMY